MNIATRSILLLGSFLVSSALCRAQTYLMQNGSTTTCSGTFYDSGGPSNGYGHNENFTYTICPNSSSTPISMTFNYLRLRNNDVLSIYEGNTTTTLINSYTNINTSTPFTITSTDPTGCLTFVFTSNASQRRPGWEATISCVTTPGIITDGVTEQLCSGTFYDSGGASSDYSSNEDITYTLCPVNPGQTSTITFTSFDVHLTDQLYIYDGDNTTTLLGIYNNANSANGLTFTSTHTSGCLTFRFVSNGGAEGSGWAATIGCNTPPGTMTNGVTDNICSGVFTDPGGSSANYSNNENVTYSICPATAGASVSIQFTSFDVEGGFDFLTIYDGATPTTSIGTFSNNNNPNGLTFTSTDASGCLTFVFTSDGSVTRPGWTADISCGFACLPVVASITSTTPTANIDGEIEICQSGTVSMTGAGTYPLSGSTYTQSDATSTFLWDFGDGNTQSGVGLTTVNHTYLDGQGYIAELTITDINGCKNSNIVLQQVAVSTTPSFLGTGPAASTICLGDTTTIDGQVTAVPFVQDCAPATSDSLLLPDGVGVSYSTTTTLTCFANGQTLTNEAELNGICLNIEHTWANDLSVQITCPTGQIVQLDSYGGVGSEVFLGEPIDNDDGSPIIGVGWDYCWSPSPTYGTWNAEAANYANDTLPAGSYASENPLSGLVGCELNGDWTITITDNVAIDNGFLFSFDIDLNTPTAPPWTYTPTITNTSWFGDPVINNPGNDPISVTPIATGDNDYVYTVDDDFGCSYDTIITLDVIAPAVADAGPTAVEVCDPTPFALDATITGQTAILWATSGDGGFSSNSVEDPVYTWGANDITNGSVVLTVTASATGPCTDSVDTIILTVAGDNDLDGVCDTNDLDDDNDGIPDLDETPSDPLVDADMDGVPVYLDDDDSDNMTGNDDGAPEAGFDTDGDGVADHLDLDSDNDGIYDLIEAGHSAADADNDGVIDGAPAAFGSNGLFDGLETAADNGVLNYMIADSDSDGNIDSTELDSDNDLCDDVIEAGYTDADGDGMLGPVAPPTVDGDGLVTSGGP